MIQRLLSEELFLFPRERGSQPSVVLWANRYTQRVYANQESNVGYKIEVKGTQSNTGKTFCSIFVAKANTEYGAQCIVEDAFDFSDAENLRFNVCAASEADMAFCRQRDVAQIS